MLRNCKVARVLPRIADCAKNDRSAVLRARFISSSQIYALLSLLHLISTCFIYLFFFNRCCNYALLILEHWPDAPEIQRLADLYEDLIRCCVADAMSEVYVLVHTQ